MANVQTTKKGGQITINVLFNQNWRGLMEGQAASLKRQQFLKEAATSAENTEADGGMHVDQGRDRYVHVMIPTPHTA
eukprot:gene18748-16467_t